MARGTRKILYGWAVDLVNPGAGQDTTEARGGYFLDGAVAPGAYPDSDQGAYIASIFTAVQQCLSEVKRMQGPKFRRDARGRVFRKIFGVDATNPKRALKAGEDDETEVCRLDYDERVVRARVRAANQEKHGDDLDLETDDTQDLDNALGG